MFTALSGLSWLREKLLSSDHCHILPYNEPLVIKYPQDSLTESNISNLIADAEKRAKNDVNDPQILLKLVNLIDLTTLNATDTPKIVHKLFSKACNPIDKTLANKLNLTDKELEKCHTAAVCVYPIRLVDVQQICQQALWNGKIKREQVPNIASVAAGFPSGQYHTESKRLEIELALRDGAEEIDIVIDRSMALQQQWIGLYKSLCQLRTISSRFKLKTIIASGELENNENIYKASIVSMLAGADFIKTSTGKETVNATLETTVVMCNAIKQFNHVTGKMIGFKAAGGIKTCEQALAYVYITTAILGNEYFDPDLLRIGASSLLDDILKRLNN